MDRMKNKKNLTQCMPLQSEPKSQLGMCSRKTEMTSMRGGAGGIPAGTPEEQKARLASQCGDGLGPGGDLNKKY